MAAISQLFVPFYSIVDNRDNRHLDDSTIVKFTIAIYRDNRQYRAPLLHTERHHVHSHHMIKPNVQPVP